MLTFTHLTSLIFFILIGGIGMASMQDGVAPIWRRLRAILGKQKTANRSLLAPGQSLTFR